MFTWVDCETSRKSRPKDLTYLGKCDKFHLSEGKGSKEEL